MHTLFFGCEVRTTMNQCNVTATDQMTDGVISIGKNFHRFQFHINQLTGASTDGFLLDTVYIETLILAANPSGII